MVNAKLGHFPFFEKRDKPVDMSGGNSVVGLRSGIAHLPADAADEDIIVAAEADETGWDETAPPRGQWLERIALGFFLLLGATWLGAAGYREFVALGGQLPALVQGVDIIARISPPLAVLLLGWLIVSRSSRTAQRRFAATSDGIRRDLALLDDALGRLAHRLAEGKAGLAEQGEGLLGIGEDAATRLGTVARALEADIGSIAKQTQTLTASAAAARGDLAVLLANLPKANVQTRQMITALQEAGLSAHEKAGALDAQLALLTARGREADEIAGNAAQKLAAHLARVEGVSEVAGARLEQAAEQMTSAVDAALERAADALETAREGMEAQGAAMTAMIEQNQAAMARAGAESAGELGRRVESIAAEIARIAQSFGEQDAAGDALMKRLNADIDSLEQRFALLESGGVARTERLAAAVKALANHSDDLKTALAGGGDTANRLVERVESLMTALDAATREIDETLPAAYQRLSAHAEESLAVVTAATPVVAHLAEMSGAARERLAETQASIETQRETLESLSALATDQVGGTRQAVDELAKAVASAAADADRLGTMAAPALVEALVRVREAASQASDHARQTLATVIPDTAKRLGEESRTALSAAIASEVGSRIGQLSETAEQAVAAAQAASDLLMRQMLTISETSAALEARIAQAQEDAEERDQSSFARRVALLIESLNSTAIDVTKIFSNDVTDTAWASYLRGDRGVFTRRAVKLLDTGEVREILRHYEADPEFREQVNRYIHDFEAMLRNVLATREGSSLGVTLLSSDNGKLYVALAQAIERLRA